jgi:hypothetical protein
MAVILRAIFVAMRQGAPEAASRRDVPDWNRRTPACCGQRHDPDFG